MTGGQKLVFVWGQLPWNLDSPISARERGGKPGRGSSLEAGPEPRSPASSRKEGSVCLEFCAEGEGQEKRGRRRRPAELDRP